MRNNGNALIIGTVVLGVLVVALFLFLRSSSRETSPPQMGSLLEKSGDEKTNDDSISITDGRYVEYKSGTLDRYIDKRRVLYFYANWCPTCRPADADFKSNANQIPEDTVIVRVNYNDSDTDSDEDQLANQYGITYQHTFVQIDSDGNEVTKWNGGQLNELNRNIK